MDRMLQNNREKVRASSRINLLKRTMQKFGPREDSIREMEDLQTRIEELDKLGSKYKKFLDGKRKKSKKKSLKKRKSKRRNN
jgi:hypothetical protein